MDTASSAQEFINATPAADSKNRRWLFALAAAACIAFALLGFAITRWR